MLVACYPSSETRLGDLRPSSLTAHAMLDRTGRSDPRKRVIDTWHGRRWCGSRKPLLTPLSCGWAVQLPRQIGERISAIS